MDVGITVEERDWKKVLLAMVFGALFAALSSVGWQLSARVWVLLAYGPALAWPFSDD
jgi:hypothetical protein